MTKPKSKTKTKTGQKTAAQKLVQKPAPEFTRELTRERPIRKLCAMCDAEPARVPVSDRYLPPIWCGVDCAAEEALALRRDGARRMREAAAKAAKVMQSSEHLSIHDIISGQVKLRMYTRHDFEQIERDRKRQIERAKYERRRAKAKTQAKAKAKASAKARAKAAAR